MSKDGTVRGGARVGVGTKRKSLADNILEGKSPPGLNQEMYDPTDLDAEDMPKVSDFLEQTQKNGEKLMAKDVARGTWKSLKKVHCEDKVNFQLIEMYSVSVARWIQCEKAISEYGFISCHSTTLNPVGSPFEAMSREYMKQINQCWYQIYQVVRDNSTEGSCQYGIDPDGRVGMYVEEKNRSWCSSSNANGQRPVIIECASDTYHPYAMNSTVYARLIDLCVDICKRNGKSKLLWPGSKEACEAYNLKSDEMILTAHRFYANKSCPGDWLYSRYGDLAAQVTARLGGRTVVTPGDTVTAFPAVPFTVQVIVDDLNYRSEPSMDGKVNGQTGKGVFTIVEVKDGRGRLKSGVGWIWFGNPSYCTVNKKDLTTKTVDELAREVFAGKWGNGEDRKNRLTAAGYNYTSVQAKVNELMGKSTTGKTVDELAREVIQRLWGNGAERKNRLTAAGYDYSFVQKKVNELMK